jgi:hypothetical protein
MSIPRYLFHDESHFTLARPTARVPFVERPCKRARPRAEIAVPPARERHAHRKTLEPMTTPPTQQFIRFGVEGPLDLSKDCVLGTVKVEVIRLRTFVEGFSTILNTTTMRFEGGIHVVACDANGSVMVVAFLSAATLGKACASVHVPTLRGILKTTPPRELVQLDVTDKHTIVQWGPISHIMPHLTLSMSPTCPHWTAISNVYSCKSVHLLKFARDSCAEVLEFVASKELAVVSVGDLCTSTLLMKPVGGNVKYNGETKIPKRGRVKTTVTVKNVVSVCKATIFSPNVFVCLDVKAIFFEFSGNNGTIQFVVASAK